MLSKIITGSVNGMDVEKVVVETDFSQGLPYLSLVGLPDMTVKESKERIRSAIINSGYSFPMKRITINLWPADTRKSGSHFDLPLAIGIISATDSIPYKMLEDAGFIGELSLDGTVNRVDSCLALVLGMKDHGIKNIYLPEDNIEEIFYIEGINIFGIRNLYEVIDHLTGMQELKPEIIKSEFQKKDVGTQNDFGDIAGQETGKRAMQICASGWHDVLLTGPPGAGKTMLASRLSSILPDPTYEELIDINKIHSIAGEITSTSSIKHVRPFRAPHHNITAAALMGGGSNPKPGELSLAHHGVLFLDELPEFDRRVLDMLRQPLEDGFINLSRLGGRHTYPCNFVMVTAMNPCPCGYYGDPTHECTCTTGKRTKYADKVSGPLRDRIDIHVEIKPIEYKKIQSHKQNSLNSREMKESVLTAVKHQSKRYKKEEFKYNSFIPDNKLDYYCPLGKNENAMLDKACQTFGLSGRAISKIKKVARTIADLDSSETIKDIHLAEAIGFRSKNMQE